MKNKIVRYFVYLAITLYCKTWRFKIHNYDNMKNLMANKKKFVIALWHDQLLPLTFSHKGRDFVTIASHSKDGSYITYALHRWGYHVGRGSSSKMGVKAALGAIKLAKEKSSPCAVTLDGPRGPRHVVKSGAIFIAKQLDGIIINAVINTKHFIKLKSWDKFVLPLPFARIDITLSDSVIVSDDISEKALEEDTKKIQNIMDKMTNEHSTNIL